MPRPTRRATSKAFDAVNKLVILARLAFDRWLDPATIADAAPTADGAGRARDHVGQPRRPGPRRGRSG